MMMKGAVALGGIIVRCAAVAVDAVGAVAVDIITLSAVAVGKCCCY